MGTIDYRVYYHLESYLFDTVHPRFHDQGYLSAFDFFCIIIWKANRAKTHISRRLLARNYPDVDAAVRALTVGIAEQPTARDRFRHLVGEWGFHLPMASAILTVLYPDEFTVYDVRVCGSIDAFRRLGTITNIDRLWQGYTDYRIAVEAAAPQGMTLRDKDRYLWGQSFHAQLIQDVDRSFMHHANEAAGRIGSLLDA